MKRTLYLAISAVLVAVCITGLPAQNATSGIGKRFGAHDPRTCASKKQPAGGAPSPAQAAQYFICATEVYFPPSAFGEGLDLVSDVKIEVGKGHPFNPLTDSYEGIDPSQQVYPIRGSYVAYKCGVAGGPGTPAGANCMKGEGQNLTGNCYKDAFGDWHCNICCILGSTMRKGFAPPTNP